MTNRVERIASSPRHTGTLASSSNGPAGVGEGCKRRRAEVGSMRACPSRSTSPALRPYRAGMRWRLSQASNKWGAATGCGVLVGLVQMYRGRQTANRINRWLQLRPAQRRDAATAACWPSVGGWRSGVSTVVHVAALGCCWCRRKLSSTERRHCTRAGIDDLKKPCFAPCVFTLLSGSSPRP